ncbi:hypothetical protein ACQ4PT_020473 [Festuca glaucescens]
MWAVWRRGAVRLLLVSTIAWALLVLLALVFHLWSCTSSVSFLSGNAHPTLSSLTRLFPRAWYSIWIDGKMELMVDPLLILERYLWRGKYSFAAAVHKHHRSIYEEDDAIKRRKRYARPLVDLQLKIYYHEGMEPWDAKKRMPSDVPEGAVLVREHTTVIDLFSCLWFNEVNLFTPRDQLSFGYVANWLGDAPKFFMFPNCEYNSLFVLHRHTREHSSKVEWAKTVDEIVKKGLKESRGGLGLWTPYPTDLGSRAPRCKKNLSGMLGRLDKRLVTAK